MITAKKTIRKTCNDIIRETKVAKEWVGFPENAIAIGCNGGGDYLILLPKKDNPIVLEDTIYSWWHETREVKVELKEIK